MAGLITGNSLNFFGSVFQSSVGYCISIINPTWRSKNLITNLSAVVMVPTGIGLPQENLSKNTGLPQENLRTKLLIKV